MNPYSTLGVKPGDDIKDVKKAYRKLANKYHPDKDGGDTKKFQEIKEAYESIKDGNTSKQYSAGNRDFNFRTQADINAFFKKHRAQQQKRNKFVNISASIPFEKAVIGGNYDISVQINGQQSPTIINVTIPAGLRNHEVLRFPNVLQGDIDLNVTFVIIPSSKWTQDGLILHRKEEFSFWELINGTSREVSTITGSKVRISIPPMTQPGTKMKLKGLGASSRWAGIPQGDMYIEILARIPKNIPVNLLNQIKDL